jgi:hypothetical protein
MTHRSNLNRFSAIFVCVALLFCRVALASMPCTPAMLSAAAMQMDDCSGSKSSVDPLCQKSCSDDPQKFEPGTAADIPAALASPSWRLPAQPAGQRLPALSPVLARANAPPLIVLFGRVRE